MSEMAWTEVYLRFENEADYAVNMPDDWIAPSERHVCDVLGEVAAGGGYLVNLKTRTVLPESLQPYVIAVPVYPKRVFMAESLPGNEVEEQG